MRTYPNVLSEDDTLALALGGKSIARFGDGELKIALGRDAKSQRFAKPLANKLRKVLLQPGANCVACIPNIASDDSPKTPFWKQYRAPIYTGLYALGETYGSAFITRPDSAPWIDRPDYWSKIRLLWEGRNVVLVRGSTKSLVAADLVGAEFVEEIVASRQHAFDDYPILLARLQAEKRRVILCLGASATALAWELSLFGVHALDLGHIGMFMRKLKDGRTGTTYEKGEAST